MLRPWWERFPQVLHDEESALEDLGGAPPTLNMELFERLRVRQYEVIYEHDGVRYPLTVTYSDLHPYFRVEVTTTHKFRTHQQPFEGNLCLLRGGTWNWELDETAAHLIAGQMPKLIADNESAGENLPAPAADHVEPFVKYYTYQTGAAIRVDGDWPTVSEADHGTLTISLDNATNPNALRGTLLTVRDSSGRIIREADPAVTTAGRTLTGTWHRLDQRPQHNNPDAILDRVGARNHRGTANRVGEYELQVNAVVFTDGISPSVEGDAWIFVISGTGPQPWGAKAGNNKRGRVTAARARIEPYLARGVRAGRSDMTARVPSLAALRDKKVVVFGAGGIGAPSAIEFAKAGVDTLSIVEWDLIDAGNAPRWVMGYQAAGVPKLDALGQWIKANWPYTNVEMVHWQLGGARLAEGMPHWEALAQVVSDADLIYDATAEVGVNYFLSELAKHTGVPYVVVSGTEGGWGGRVARFRPDPDTACWNCLMHQIEDERADGVAALSPPADPDPATGRVWPAGCTDPTFSGTGFDIMQVAMAGVRIAAATLCEGVAEGYPTADWDVAVFHFRDAAAAHPGTATTHQVAQHPACEPCRRRRSG